MKTALEIQAWLTRQIAAILKVSEDEIDPDKTFDSFGLGSVDAVSLSGDLEDYLDRRLSPTLLYQYPTIRLLATHLAGDELKPVTPATGAGPAPDRASADLPEDEVEDALLKKLQELDG
jgi:acyl carrier protein